MDAATDSSLLDQLSAAAAVRTRARRRLADVRADPGPARDRVDAASDEYQAATDAWAGLIRRAVAEGHGVPVVARAARCTRQTVYARSRQQSVAQQG